MENGAHRNTRGSSGTRQRASCDPAVLRPVWSGIAVRRPGMCGAPALRPARRRASRASRRGHSALHRASHAEAPLEPACRARAARHRVGDPAARAEPEKKVSYISAIFFVFTGRRAQRPAGGVATRMSIRFDAREPSARLRTVNNMRTYGRYDRDPRASSYLR